MDLLTGDVPKPNFLQKAGRFAKNVLFPTTANADAMRDNTADMIANQRFLQDRQFEFNLAQMQCQYVQEKERQEWQAGEADKQRGFLSQESANQRQWGTIEAEKQRGFQQQENLIVRQFQANQAEIQRQFQSGEADKQRFWQEQQNALQIAFQKWVVEFNQECQERQLRSRQEYEQYLLEQRHKWEIEAQQRGHEFQFFLEQFRVQAARDRDQFTLILRDQPWKTQPMPILHEYENFRKVNQAVPLLVVVSPPVFKLECPVKNPEPPDITKGIETNLTRFLEDHYPKESKTAPARPVANLWNAAGKTGDPAVIDLHYLFGSVPTLILESEVNAGKLSFQVFLWDAGQQQYRKTSILRDFDYQNLLKNIQQQKAVEWYHQKQHLQARGLDVAKAMPTGSENAVHEHNLVQYIQEREYEAAGIRNITGQYYPTPSGIAMLMEYLSVIHCLTAGLFLDSYHFLRSRVRPQMPNFIGGLAARLPEGEVQGLVNIVLDYCEGLVTQQEQVGNLNIPELLLDFALGFQALKIPIAMARLTNAALDQWLSDHGLEGGTDPVKTLETALSVRDVAFVAKLNQCWKQLELEHRLDVVVACYNRGLQRLNNQDYAGAIVDFDQVIYLNPQNANGYFQRGLAYLGLKQQTANTQALADFNQVLVLEPQRIETYRWRGEAHYQLGNHEAALADLRIAADRGVAEAEARWQIVQGVWADLQRRQQEEQRRQEEARIQREEQERQRQARKARQEKAQRHFQEGMQHWEQGNYDQAIVSFDQAEQYGHREAQAKAQEVKAEMERRKNLIYKLPNGGGDLEFVWVPGGVLTMEGGHKVTLKEFRISKYPITQRQYQAIRGNNPSYFQGDDLTPEEKQKGFTNLDRPVEQVTWQDARDFCTELSGQDYMGKQAVSLPSETQWEWAARGATKSKGTTYAGSNNLDEVGWYTNNSSSKTHPVGQKAANELEIHDMSGNVWEWCMDNWTDNANVLPPDGTPLTGGGNSSYRALRGGAWLNHSGNCTSAYRLYVFLPGNRSSPQGFRVVLS